MYLIDFIISLFKCIYLFYDTSKCCLHLCWSLLYNTVLTFGCVYYSEIRGHKIYGRVELLCEFRAKYIIYSSTTTALTLGNSTRNSVDPRKIAADIGRVCGKVSDETVCLLTDIPCAVCVCALYERIIHNNTAGVQ